VCRFVVCSILSRNITDWSNTSNNYGKRKSIGPEPGQADSPAWSGLADYRKFRAVPIAIIRKHRKANVFDGPNWLRGGSCGGCVAL